MKSRVRLEPNEVMWNITTGCTRLSPGCRNCYAAVVAQRLRNLRAHQYREGFSLRVHEELLKQPASWSVPREVFVSPMSDLFHPNVPQSFIQRTFEVIASCPQHRFQILTKRARRLRDLAPALHWPSNLGIGVSVEDQRRAWRAEALQNVPATSRFLALEPLLGPIHSLPLDGIDWVMIGGESGPRARTLQAEWIDDIVAQCQARGVSFVLEHWGGTQKIQMARAIRRRAPQIAAD